MRELRRLRPTGTGGGTTNRHSWVRCYSRATRHTEHVARQLQSLSLLARNTALDTTAWSPNSPPHSTEPKLRSQGCRCLPVASCKHEKFIYHSLDFSFWMTSIDIKLKALISILSGFQFLHPCEHTLILLHNCPILTGRIMQPCVTATSMSCHSPDLLHLSPLANSNTRSSYPHSQPGAAETEHLLPRVPRWMQHTLPRPGLHPLKERHRAQKLSGVRHHYHITPAPPSKKPQPSSCIQANAGTEQHMQTPKHYHRKLQPSQAPRSLPPAPGVIGPGTPRMPL